MDELAAASALFSLCQQRQPRGGAELGGEEGVGMQQRQLSRYRSSSAAAPRRGAVRGHRVWQQLQQ